MEYRVPKMQTPETNQKVFADWMRDDGKLNKNVGRGQEEGVNALFRLIGFANELDMKDEGRD